MIASLYCVGALVSSSVWLSAFLQDETTPNSDIFSWTIVLIATLSWPLSVPLAIRELQSKKQAGINSAQSLDAIGNGSISLLQLD